MSAAIDRWALGEACEQLAQWDRQLKADTPRKMFINVSVFELIDPGFVDRVRATLELFGLEADRLTFEITETGFVSEPQDVVTAAHRLSRVGCHIAIDDFGVGFSSVRRLLEIPRAMLKVDRSFSADIESNPESSASLTSLLHLGHSLHRTVIVEGVETPGALRELVRLGCEYAQGYFLTRPAPAAELAPLLAS
jgi:EAL domain-containing protein (putative c-di-GMP-specific phosphodiesterase class I)